MGQPTALIVEDDDIHRNIIALLLEERDFAVVQYDDAETAIVAVHRS